MIICRRCGGRNRDSDDFCGSCGAFLEWSGERVVPEISEEVRQEAEESAAAAPRVPLMQRLARLANPGVRGTPEAMPTGPGMMMRPP
ncbi:hypothetical protein G3M53_81065, partial [Streptomyces sp. SID7982]|nr:hypothetical protein [Streptomyces sp. SID7982]